MKPISEGHLRSQALRCEHAKHKRCKCRCGGLLHGTKHGDDWISEEVFRDRLRCQQVPDQMDWVGYEGMDHYL